MFVIGLILTIMNFTVLAKNKLDTYIKVRNFQFSLFWHWGSASFLDF